MAVWAGWLICRSGRNCCHSIRLSVRPAAAHARVSQSWSESCPHMARAVIADQNVRRPVRGSAPDPHLAGRGSPRPATEIVASAVSVEPCCAQRNSFLNSSKSVTDSGKFVPSEQTGQIAEQDVRGFLHPQTGLIGEDSATPA
jgi:hypothetical protein